MSLAEPPAPSRETPRQRRASSASAVAGAAPAPRVGVVCTTCVSGGVETLTWWCRYHAALGVSAIYLYVHDAAAPIPLAAAQQKTIAAPADDLADEKKRAREEASLLGAVRRALADCELSAVVTPLAALVGTAVPSSGGVDVVAMQERNAADAIKRAQTGAVDWLVHCDDDELLHLTRRGAREHRRVRFTTSGSARGASFSSEKRCVVYENALFCLLRRERGAGRGVCGRAGRLL